MKWTHYFSQWAAVNKWTNEIFFLKYDGSSHSNKCTVQTSYRSGGRLYDIAGAHYGKINSYSSPTMAWQIFKSSHWSQILDKSVAVSTKYRTHQMEYNTHIEKLSAKITYLQGYRRGRLQVIIHQMHFTSCDYRYNKDEHSIEPHIYRDHAFFNIRDKALTTMGRYFFKYTLAIIIYKKRKIETNTIFTVAGRWKHVIKNQALSRIMVVFTRKILKHVGYIDRKTVLFKLIK